MPSPTTVTVTSSMESPITSGADVTLTCAVELSAALASVPSVSVAITWTGPTGVLQSNSMPVMSPPTYTDTLLVDAVMSDGTYICEAITISSSPYLLSSGLVSDDVMIIIGKMVTLL